MGKRILLVDDHQMVLDGLAYIFQQGNRFEVVSKVNSGKEALRVIENIKVDVVITDMDMPNMTGLELLEKIKDLNNEIKVVILSMHSDNQLVKKVMQKNADGYVLKSSDEEEMILAVDQVCNGKKFISNTITENLLSKSDTPTTYSESLSKRELEILKLVAEGYNSHEIGEQLFISSRTVETHRTNIMNKLEIKNTVGLVRYAIQHKLV